MAEAKTQVGEELGEVFGPSPRISGKIVRQLRRGSGATYTVYSAGRALLTSTEDLFRLWKRYLKDHLNPSGASSVEEVESGDERDDLSIKSIGMGHSFLLQLLQVLGPHSR